MGNISAFPYYGAKMKLLKDLLPMLPQADHYCEPFAGSGAVLLNRPRSPIETLNDINGEIVHFFKTLRENTAALIGALQLTPYANEEFRMAWQPTDDQIERARRFYVRILMDYCKGGAKKDRAFSTNATYDPSQFSYAPLTMMKKVAGLPDIVARLRLVQIENRPAVEIIQKYGHKRTLFYCDPPYLPEVRTSANDYVFEMSLEDHEELADALNQTRAMVALSGYDNPTMDRLYPPQKWHKTSFKTRRVPMSRTGTRRTQEVLWTNYNPNTITQQLALL